METERKVKLQRENTDSVPDGRRFYEYDLKTENDLPGKQEKERKNSEGFFLSFLFSGYSLDKIIVPNQRNIQSIKNPDIKIVKNK